MHKYSIKIQYGISVRLGGESGRVSSVWGKGFEMLGSERRRRQRPLEGLVVVAGLGGVSEGLADVAVGPLVRRVAVVGGVRHRVGALGLSGAVLGVVQVEAVADVAEEARRGLLLPLGHAFVETDEWGGVAGGRGGGGGETLARLNGLEVDAKYWW